MTSACSNQNTHRKKEGEVFDAPMSLPVYAIVNNRR